MGDLKENLRELERIVSDRMQKRADMKKRLEEIIVLMGRMRKLTVPADDFSEVITHLNEAFMKVLDLYTKLL